MMVYVLSYHKAQAQDELEFLLALYSRKSHMDNGLSVYCILLLHTEAQESCDPCSMPERVLLYGYLLGSFRKIKHNVRIL